MTSRKKLVVDVEELRAQAPMLLCPLFVLTKVEFKDSFKQLHRLTERRFTFNDQSAVLLGKQLTSIQK